MLGIHKHTKLATKRRFSSFSIARSKFLKNVCEEVHFMLDLNTCNFAIFRGFWPYLQRYQILLKIKFADNFQEVIFTDPIFIEFYKSLACVLKVYIYFYKFCINFKSLFRTLPDEFFLQAILQTFFFWNFQIFFIVCSGNKHMDKHEKHMDTFPSSSCSFNLGL